MAKKRVADSQIVKKVTDPIVLKGDKKNVVIGYVPEIHRDGETATIDITKHEAVLLVEAWIEKMQDVETEWDMGQSSSWGIRIWPYANMRINAIADSGVLTDDEIKSIFERMYGVENVND